MLLIDNDWEYTSNWSDDLLTGGHFEETVRLPHNVEPMPLHYADSDSYQKIVGYRKSLDINYDPSRRYFLQFDAAGHIADVYFNGQYVAHHGTGYTAFRAEITDFIDPAGDNTVIVKLNTTEDPSVPPFGFVIDYLTYGGLYRHVWLDDRNPTFLKDAWIRTPSCDHMIVEYAVDSPDDMSGLSLKAELFDVDGSEVFCGQNQLIGPIGALDFDLPEMKTWSPETPELYKATLTLMKDSEILDEVTKTVGFRTIGTDATNILLNGKPYFIRGLNRHQCYPYVGYAAPDSLQEEDARILKEELGLNSVRTSHYPQSHAFLDACDRLGLLVFTEIPGWQHLGGDQWKDQAVQNVREMVMEYRQHPSIYMWGVRINESLDDDELYKRTNREAHRLDPDRPTSGVRYLEKSSLLEDVYAYNDFSHNGETPGCKPKKDVTPDMNKPLIITEANGHMFPTKAFDPWSKRQEHALRHSRVLNAAMADHGHAGCYQWCMFDYLTHKDFGSGDRVCYHGVMDTFRNPKLAASVYSSQQEEYPVLEIGSSMDIGDYPAGHIGPVFAFTNCDEVRLYKNGDLVKAYRPKPNGGMVHPPILIDDFIGDLLQTREGFPKAQADIVRRCLLAAGRYGMAALPMKYKALLGYCMAKYKMTYDQGVQLYSKYVGNWGGDATSWTFEGWKNGIKVVTRVKTPGKKLHLEAVPSHTRLTDGATYDMASVRMCLKDENGNITPYAQIPVKICLEGPGKLVGPDTVVTEGGMTGTYVMSAGEPGQITLTLSPEGLEPIKLFFNVEII